MIIKILTIFPEMFTGPFQTSILKRAQQRGLLRIEVINIRDYSLDKHRKVDDYPFGGGAGMVIKPEPVYRCLMANKENPKARVILLTPQGKTFTQKIAQELAQEQEVILICGHYEGIDERVKHFVDEEISLGDFVLTGGEIAAMAVTDSVARLVPGVVGDQESLKEESFSLGLLEYPQYTRPRRFLEWEVPQVLLSGDHQAIARWRRAQAVQRTFFRRPDLLRGFEWSDQERKAIDEIFQTEAPANDGSSR
ncbi:MAG: tRNA (guanine-N(1)-)-methyltransferase [Thermoanaerobacterales bacterium 50_218]|nr:MAG: tRNA (guanine-N(1)-)-methyltransferase [Thermoanaerobacterales bacterium 50_218]HAA90212.1 tRNA (guanosine(37)-N1)-methyltransferase TrmD [Peptococcaceae bacterium]